MALVRASGRVIRLRSVCWGRVCFGNYMPVPMAVMVVVVVVVVMVIMLLLLLLRLRLALFRS